MTDQSSAAVEADGEASSVVIDDEFYRILVANTSEGLLTIDTESRILFANPAIEDLLGYAPTELVGSSKLEIIPERLRAVHERRLAAYLETDERHIDWDGVELPALHKDGHEVPVMISLREHEYDGDRLFTGLFRDISTIKEQERVLREQNERLEQFASVLSHDLRNPLNVVQGLASLPLEEIGDAELEEISLAAARMNELIDNMLTLTQADGPVEQAEPVTVGEVAADSWRWVDTADASLDVVGDPLVIEADPSHVGSLFENLFRNAVDHGGTEVTVRVGPLPDRTGFFVEDDGPGIPADRREEVFERGVTTSTDGVGLGLSIVSTVAEAHDWAVTLATSESGGARFEFVV